MPACPAPPFFCGGTAAIVVGQPGVLGRNHPIQGHGGVPRWLAWRRVAQQRSSRWFAQPPTQPPDDTPSAMAAHPHASSWGAGWHTCKIFQFGAGATFTGVANIQIKAHEFFRHAPGLITRTPQLGALTRFALSACKFRARGQCVFPLGRAIAQPWSDPDQSWPSSCFMCAITIPSSHSGVR